MQYPHEKETPPIRARGVGGHKVRPPNSIYDHFALQYWFPNDLVLSFNSHQSGFGYDDIMCRVYGVTGTAEAHYSGDILVRARDDIYNGGKASMIYAEGVTNNVKTFYESIIKGDFSNPTVAASVRSNLTTILGRTAAYRNAVVTWDEMIRANEKLDLRLPAL